MQPTATPHGSEIDLGEVTSAVPPGAAPTAATVAPGPATPSPATPVPGAPEPAPAGVYVENLWRYFGEMPALAGMSFAAPYGQVTALVGPNGAGKTTLLLVLASLLRPHQGRAVVGGADPTLDPVAVRARVGWMPDTFGVYDQLTAREYLRFFGGAYDLDRATLRQRVPELLALVHLTEYADRPVHVLSRGQKQRLALTRALVHRPSVLLLDEPASGLDPRSRVELRDILRGLAAQGVAVLVSSHILTELEEVADRVVLVSRGRTLAEYTMTDLHAHASRPYRVRALDAAALSAALVGQRVPPPGADGSIELPPMTEAQAAERLGALVRAGIPVVEFEPLGSNLESLYLAMTEERL